MAKVTIKQARKLLGRKAESLSDEAIHKLIQKFELLAVCCIEKSEEAKNNTSKNPSDLLVK